MRGEVALLLLAVCVVGLWAAVVPENAPSRNTLLRAAQKDHQRRTVNAYRTYVNHYRTAYNQTHARKKGKCQNTPAWQINGTYPVLDQIQKGNAVVIFTMKKSCKKCWHEVAGLNMWAKYFKEIGAKMKVMVLMSNNYGQYPRRVYQVNYPYIHFYNEPKGQDIFGKLKAGIYNFLVYDKCGRHQYHYKYPYSSLVKPYVRIAMENTLYHHEHETLGCGSCRQKATYPSPEDADFEFPPTEKIPTNNQGPSLS